MTYPIFNSADLHYQIAFGYSPEQLKMALGELKCQFERAADVGCGTGRHTVALARQSPLGTVFSCEPDPVMFEHALRNLREAQAQNAFLVHKSLTEFVWGNEFRFDFIHSCMISHFVDMDFSDFAKQLVSLASRNATVLFTDFALDDREDREANRLNESAFRRLFPTLQGRPIQKTNQILSVFENLGWQMECQFNMQERYPDPNLGFSHHLPQHETDRRSSVLRVLQSEFFLSEPPKISLTRTFILKNRRNSG